MFYLCRWCGKRPHNWDAAELIKGTQFMLFATTTQPEITRTNTARMCSHPTHESNKHTFLIYKENL